MIEELKTKYGVYGFSIQLLRKYLPPLNNNYNISMKPQHKETLISAWNTFVSVFLLTIASGIDLGNLDRATLISLGAVAFRAGVKAIQQHIASRL